MVGTLAALVMTVLPASAQTVEGWPQFQGGPDHAGVASDGPAPGYSVDWTLAVAPGGPGDQYGLSAPVSAGDLIVAVGPEAVIGVDATAGTQTWSVDRDLGPSVPAAITSIGGRDVRRLLGRVRRRSAGCRRFGVTLEFGLGVREPVSVIHRW